MDITWITCKKCNLKYKHKSSFNRHKPKCSKFQEILKSGKNSYPFQRYYNQCTKAYDTPKNNDISCSNEGQMVTSLSENHNQRNEEDNIHNETEKLAFVQNPHIIPNVSTCEIDMCGRQTQTAKAYDTQKNNDISCLNEGLMVTSLSENHNQMNEEDIIPNETEKLALVQNPHIPNVSTCEIDMYGRQSKKAKAYDTQKNNDISCSNERQMVTSLSENHNQRNEEDYIPIETEKLAFVQSSSFIPKPKDTTHKWNNVSQIIFNQNSYCKLSNVETESYLCNLCGMRQTSHLALHKHTNLHSINKRHMCKHPTCNMQFYHILLLKDHLCVEHPEFKQFVCGYCSKWFQMKGTLRKHIELFHMQ